MKNWKILKNRGSAAVVLFAGLLVLASGCVEEHVTHVERAYPVAVQVPPPPPPPPMVTPPPPVIELPPPTPPPAPLVRIRSDAELDRMLAPIALYPDPLLAQILPAATLPEQIVLVDRYLREGGDINQVDAQPWDNSLKALARYPGTLRMLDDNLAWTTDLGQVFLNQPADVMESVQRLRAQARAVGNLQSTPQQTVVVSGGVIEILPPSPQVIYVPVYQPEVVYVQPPPSPGHFRITFGAGLVIGAWLNHDCDWNHHEVIVWHHDRPRPNDWWSRPPARRETPTVVNNVTVVNNTTIVNQHFTVWHPQTHGPAADRGDRGWRQPDARTTGTPGRTEMARTEQTDRRQAPVVVEAQNPAPSREVRPASPPKEPRPTQTEVQPPPVRQEARDNSAREEAKPTTTAPIRETRPAPPRKPVQPAPAAPRETATTKPTITQAPATPSPKPANNQQLLARESTPAPRPNQPIPAPKDPRPAATPVAAKPTAAPASTARPATPPASARPAANAPARTPSSALTGIESSQGTREASARGQQSRQSIAKPVAAPRPAPAAVASPKGNPAEAKKPQPSRAK